MKRLGTGLLVGAVLVSAMLLGGCKPGKTGSGAIGEGITEVDSHPKAFGAYAIREIDGVEYNVSRDPEGKPGGTFYAASIGEGPKTFNYWVSKDGTSSEIGGAMTAGLVTSDPGSGDPIPDLAKSVTVAEDNKTYTVVLRKGLQWSDGKPLTADDVVFTWNTLVKEGYGNPSARDNTLVEGKFPLVRKVDDLTVEFRTAKPFVPFIRRLGQPIAPAHIMEPVIKAAGKEAHQAFDAFWGNSTATDHPEQFVSCGMWLLESYDPALQKVVFKRNPNYHMVDRSGTRLPYLDKYVISFVGDMNNLALQFEQGNVDVYGVPGNQLSHIRKLQRPQFTMFNLGPSDTKTFLIFNLAKRTENGKPVISPVRSRWFNSTEFRQAVDWAINREDMVANILKGVGAPSYTAESPVSPFIHPKLAEGHPRDIAKAKELLKKGGFTYDEKGNLLDSEGNPVEFELLTNSGNDQRENVGVNVKEDLAELGIKVNFKPIEFNVLTGKYDTGAWEASIMGLGGGSPLEPHDGANVWKSDGALHMFNQRDISRTPVDISDRLPWEKEIDQVFEKAAQVFDQAKRRELYLRYQEIVAEQQPFIYLFSPLRIFAVRSRLQNIKPTPLGGVTHNMESIWIQE